MAPLLNLGDFILCPVKELKELCKVVHHEKDEPLFIELYKKTASQMLSEDVHIGMSLMLSYSNLKEFHACLVEYKTNPSDFNKNNDKYLKIYTKV